MAGSEPARTEVNRAVWDGWAAAAGTDAHYDAAALVAGTWRRTEVEQAAVELAVGDVAGRAVCHLQCHLGFDAIEFARSGAQTVGVDFSPVALARAAELAVRCGVTVDLVEADATALPATLHGRFDLVYATFGVLPWIGDVDSWMVSVASVLGSRGALALVEHHPVLSMVANLAAVTTGGARPVFGRPYQADGPVRPVGRAAAVDAGAGPVPVVYAHGLGRVVTAAVRAGLVVDHLVEHFDSPLDWRGEGLVADGDGRFRARVDGQLLPASFTLVARRPG